MIYLQKLKAYTGSDNNLHSIQWINVYSTDERSYQSSLDGNDCRVYVMNYMDHIGRNVPFEMEFDPVEYRIYVAKVLVQSSESVKTVCLHCFQRNEEKRYECFFCKRFCHEKCLPEVKLERIRKREMGKDGIIQKNIPLSWPKKNKPCKACTAYLEMYYA